MQSTSNQKFWVIWCQIFWHGTGMSGLGRQCQWGEWRGPADVHVLRVGVVMFWSRFAYHVKIVHLHLVLRRPHKLLAATTNHQSATTI